MPDEMFFSEDSRSLVKGQRRDRRTATRRLVVFKPKNGTSRALNGIILDLNPYSMRIRSPVKLPVGTLVQIFFRRSGVSLNGTRKIEGRVARSARVENRRFDLGVELDVPAIDLPKTMALEVPQRRGGRARPAGRMHIVDFVIGG